jgi:hypothetical protein
MLRARRVNIQRTTFLLHAPSERYSIVRISPPNQSSETMVVIEKNTGPRIFDVYTMSAIADRPARILCQGGGDHHWRCPGLCHGDGDGDGDGDGAKSVCCPTMPQRRRFPFLTSRFKARCVEYLIAGRCCCCSLSVELRSNLLHLSKVFTSRNEPASRRITVSTKALGPS